MDYRYGLVRNRSGVWRSLRDGDFDEDDVWDVLREKKKDSKTPIESSNSVPRNLSVSAARMIPRATSSGGSCGSSNNSCNETKVVQQQSAPVNIPDWSKICTKKKSFKKGSGSPWLDTDADNDDDYDQDDGDDDNHGAMNVGDSDDEYEDDGDNNYKLPPHELISRRLARSQISSFSVFEGVGRKLKGRDLSKVRNAVLTKTGFLESP